MQLDVWLYYLLAILVLTASPGPSILLCLSKSVSNGFPVAFLTALGSLTAIMAILTLSFTGLGIVIASSELLFSIIKWMGSAYLIVLGYKAFTSKEHTYKESNTDTRSFSPTTRLSHYISGFLVGASNPKAIVFFAALFPQFINLNEPLLTQYFIFAITFAVLELSCLLIYAYLGSKSSNWLTKNGRAKFFNKITGSAFISAGVLLATFNKATN